jgi:aminoglycoside 6'-N-acetyltransferase I
MRDALWPGAFAVHDAETRAHFEAHQEMPIVFVAEDQGTLVGFLELDYRQYAPGTSASPVPFVEACYVEPELRRRGIGRSLFLAAERWARSAGHDEIASDTDLRNPDGIAAHLALGYEEVERVACFRRSLLIR